MAEDNGRYPRVLVVDDDVLIALTTAAILELEGYDTATAFNGESAIQKARFFQPQLLLTDICMPAPNGAETARQVTALCPDCQVIFTSGDGEACDWVRMFAPESPILAKPIHPLDLLKTISLLLGPDKAECIA